MAALTQDVEITQYGVPGDAHQQLNLPVEANATIYRGSIGLLRASTGLLKNASAPSSTDVCVGIIDTGGPGYPNFTPGIANLSTLTGYLQVTADIRTGSFYVASDGTLAQSTVGQTVYVKDEITVSAVQGSLPKAGILLFIDPTPPPTALGAYVVKFNVVGGP